MEMPILRLRWTTRSCWPKKDSVEDPKCARVKAEAMAVSVAANTRKATGVTSPLARPDSWLMATLTDMRLLRKQSVYLFTCLIRHPGTIAKFVICHLVPISTHPTQRAVPNQEPMV